MDGTEVGVLEETNHVGLRCLLEGEDSGGLETEFASVLRGDFTDESLERKFPDEELGALLESSDLSESDGSWSESVWFLDSTGGGGLLGSSLVGDVLSWVLGSGVLTGGLLCACHNVLVLFKIINSYLLYSTFKWNRSNICVFIG